MAKDVTSSNKIINIIIWYQNNQGIVKRDDKVIDDVDAIQEELDSQENQSQAYGMSSFTASPTTLNDDGGLKGMIKQNRSN